MEPAAEEEVTAAEAVKAPVEEVTLKACTKAEARAWSRKQKAQHREDHLKALGRLTGAYKEQYFWYELVMAVYRLFMVCILPLMARGERGQVVLGKLGTNSPQTAAV